MTAEFFRYAYVNTGGFLSGDAYPDFANGTIAADCVVKSSFLIVTQFDERMLYIDE
jgi:hypothetical protein